MTGRPGPTPWARGDVWAQSAAEARAFDARAIEQQSVPQPVLMENAGRCAAHLAARMYAGGTVVGLVGSGNNGGDALVALRTLAAWGIPVQGVSVGDARHGDPLAHGWPLTLHSASSMDADAWHALLADASLVIDGLLGTGVRGAPRAPHAEVIDIVNRSEVPVLALDVPSGVDATTGGVGGSAIRAHTTVSFGAPKTGSLLHPARAFVGRQVVVEIGFPPIQSGDAVARVVTPAWATKRIPGRGTDTHKNRVGRVLVVGGGSGMAGAVLLAARAAFRTGAGLVRIAAEEANRAAIQAALPEAMFVAFDDVGGVDDAVEASDAIVVGPGLGQSDAAAAALRRVQEQWTGPTLLDADALNLVAKGVVDARSWAGSVLATPHPGELARLLPGVDGDRLTLLDAAVEAVGGTVLLKGAPSIVAGAGGPVWIDTQSSSDLAVAGMGDTLSGVAGTLLAQGLPPDEAGALALYLSGRAARLADLRAGLTPSDVIDHLPEAMSERPPEQPESGLPFVLFESEPPR